jgi:hypothetical protein
MRILAAIVILAGAALVIAPTLGMHVPVPLINGNV